MTPPHTKKYRRGSKRPRRLWSGHAASGHPRCHVDTTAAGMQSRKTYFAVAFVLCSDRQNRRHLSVGYFEQQIFWMWVAKIKGSGLWEMSYVTNSPNDSEFWRDVAPAAKAILCSSERHTVLKMMYRLIDEPVMKLSCWCCIHFYLILA